MFTTLNASLIKQWAEARGYTLDQRGLQVFASPGRIIRMAVPTTPLKMLALIRGLFLTGVSNYEPEDFPGGGVFLTDFAIWDQSADAIGWSYYEGILARAGFPLTIEAAPGVFVGSGRANWLRISALGFLPLAFQWDGWFLSQRDSFLAFVSHHQYIDVALQNEFDGARLRNEMSAIGIEIVE